MTTQNLQVFIKSEELSTNNPTVIACYPETRQLPTDVHGAGMSIYVLPVEAIKQPTDDDRVPRLVDNWQSMIQVSLMAASRIGQTFTLEAQIDSLRKTIESMMTYGTDLSKWPQSERQHKADADALWKYVDEVNTQAKAHAVNLPHDVSSDKVWPVPPGYQPPIHKPSPIPTLPPTLR